MSNLKEMVELLTGEFDNRAQFEAKEQAGEAFPYARHVNTVCNDKITNLPELEVTDQDYTSVTLQLSATTRGARSISSRKWRPTSGHTAWRRSYKANIRSPLR